MKDRRKTLLLLVAVAVLVVVPLYAIKVWEKLDYTDFLVYYRAASRAKSGAWDSVYTFADGTSPFRYLPILLPLLRPFAALSLRHAQLLWYFLQCLFFGTGFLFLYRAARQISPERAVIATALSFFFILRFCLDTFTIGQVASLMFCGYCLGLDAYIRGDYFKSGAGLLAPTIFKIGPGFSYLLYPFSKLEHWLRAWIAAVSGIAALAVSLAFLTGWGAEGRRRILLLFSGWTRMVVGDDSYYDASHYGSQSLKSALLRWSHLHWITEKHAYLAWFAISAVGCALVLGVWATRRARSALGRGLMFSLGVFPYLWFMPETFKYSLTMIALPALMLFLQPRRTKLGWAAIFSGVALLSLAGKDLMPDALFFGLQRASFPFFATILIGAAILQAIYDPESTVAWNRSTQGLPRPWAQLPQEARSEGISVLIPLGEALPSRATLSVIPELQGALKRRFGSQWELLWIAPPSMAHLDQATRLRDLVERYPGSRLLFASERGRGFSLREGFLHSQGRWIYLYRLEQPVNPRFVDEAMDRLKAGEQLVRANRRDPRSRFLIPVKHLSLAYGRHRMGLLFNRLVRMALPHLRTTDTHSGHVLLERRSAARIFALQTCGDFLFDLELCVAARALGLRESELPVNLFLFEEKSGGRIMSEVISILTGLPRLRWRLRRGCYSPLSKAERITADDWGLSPAVNRGILDLAKRGVIRRVSLMANTRYLEEGLAELKEIPGIELGLHFTLTYGRPLSAAYEPRSPKRLLLDWLLSRGSLAAPVQAELRAQLAKLRELGITIAYFDGHHHIHLVPGLLDGLAPILKEAGIRVVRVPYDPALGFSLKFPLIPLSLLARRAVARHGFQSLEVFYPQRIHFMDQGLMRAKMNLNPRAEVIVHPASHNDIETLEFPDSYASGRVEEFRALQMLAFTGEGLEGLVK